MDIQRVEEFRITADQQKAIHRLLAVSFPGYPAGRTYYKQLPNFRFLAYHHDQLVGHLAVEHRMIAIDKKAFSIFGIVDICVAPKFRGQQIAVSLLDQLENLGTENHIDFLMLTASEHQFYLDHGYQLQSNTCRWLFVNEHRTLGVKHHHLSDAIMIKALGKSQWLEGTVDFLGTVF